MRAYLSYSATNRSHYKNLALDYIYDKLRTTFDPKEREALVDLWQQIIIEEAPRHNLAEMPIEYAIRDNIAGFTFLEDSLLWYHPLKRK